MADEIINALRDEYHSRCLRNSSYSLRAFANSLGYSHTLLSMVLSKKRPPSRKFIEKVKATLEIKEKSNEFANVETQGAKIVSDWVHYAILSLLEFDDFRTDPKWIAKKLRVTQFKARSCFDDLVKGRFIEMVDGRWRPTTKQITVSNTQADRTISDLIRQLLRKSEDSIELDPFEMRDLRAITFTLNEEDLPYAKKRMTEFRRQLACELENRGNATHVYSLGTQLFPLSNKIKEKS